MSGDTSKALAERTVRVMLGRLNQFGDSPDVREVLELVVQSALHEYARHEIARIQAALFPEKLDA